MLHILMVDDDELFLETVQKNLERQKERDEAVFRVFGATTPEAALEIAGEPSLMLDVLLIDVNLNARIDGIELMTELQSRHSDSDTIVFTGFDDQETGQRAFEMGAYRYLVKPVKPSELALILLRLSQQRSIQRERNWLKVLTDVAEKSQRATSKQEVASIIVEGGHQLGFQRARLWWTSKDGKSLELAAHVGSPEIDCTPPITLSISDSRHAQEIIETSEAAFFDDSKLGPTDLERILGEDNFRTPVGEWAGIALRSGERLLAILILDNQNAPHRYSTEQRKLISLFGQQAAVAIEKAHLFELEQQKSRELAMLNQIGQQITSKAAEDLDTLLLDLREKIGEFVDVSNFLIVLKDEDIQKLDVRLQFEHNQQCRRRWVNLDHGLVGYMISANEEIFEPEGTIGFLKRYGLKRRGPRAKSWLGVPLRVAEKAIGALAVQSYTHKHAFTLDQKRFLSAVADTIAGAIRAAWAREKEAAAARRLEGLQRISIELMSLADESDELFWHAVLTAATADYGLQFNRAMLFMLERGSQELKGVNGVGELDSKAAGKSWEKDNNRGVDFERYLQEKRGGKLKPTPVEVAVKSLTLNADFEGSCLQQALEKGLRKIVTADQAADALPETFIQVFGLTNYAVLPLRAANRTLGVIIVDNIHNRYPLQSDHLEQLENLLVQSALVFQNVQQRRIRDTILDTNYQVVSKAAHVALQETLEHICIAVKKVCEADSVVIYPLASGEPRYDQSAIAAIGLKEGKPTTDKIRQHGVTAHVLKRGTLLVPSVAESSLSFGNKPLKRHSFIERENVQAFLGIRIKDAVSSDVIGAIYLNYSYPRQFTDRDRQVAEMFAGMAATAIRTTREAEKSRSDLAKISQLGEASRQELIILQRVLEESLVSDTSEDKLIPVILHAAHGLLDQPEAQIALLVRTWTPPAKNDEEPQEIQMQYYLKPSGELVMKTEPDVFRGISGQVMQNGIAKLVRDIESEEIGKYYYGANGTHKSELDIPIQSGRQVIAVLNAEHPQANVFNDSDLVKIGRLAKVTTLAFDNVRRQSHLRALLGAAKAMTSPTGLPETLDAIVNAARSIAPELSAFTVWYKTPENNDIWLGSYYGVKDVSAIRQRAPEPESVVAKTMNRDAPLWAEDAQKLEFATHLGTRFVKEEKIVSCAALPLRVSDESIGAMFFNYRTPHTFSIEERAVYPLLAELAGISIRDAALLHAADQEKQRLGYSLEITDAVGTTLDPYLTLSRVLEKLKEIFPSATPCVLLFNEEKNTLEFDQASLDFYEIDNPEFFGMVSLPLSGNGLSVQTAHNSIRTGEPSIDIYPSVERKTEYLRFIKETKSQMNAGLLGWDKSLLGVLVLESSEENAFPSEIRGLVRGIARQISMAIERAGESEKLRFKTSVASHMSWAAEIAHDAGKEIAYIRNRAYWISAEDDFDTIRRYADEIDKSAEHLSMTIESDIDINRGETWQMGIDIDELTRRCLKEIVEDKFPEIRVSFEPRSSGTVVRANRETARRILRHVLRNAIEAMERTGEIKCGISLLPPDTVELRIQDSGPGITEDQKYALGRKPFTTKDGENRGYGLFLTRSLLEDIGGKMSIRRLGPDGGTEVILCFRLIVMGE